MRGHYLLAALPLTCLFAGNALGQACTKPLALANEMQMESSGPGSSTVPVKINGTDRKLTLSLNSSSTTLGDTAIKDLKLEPKRAEQVMIDDAGNQYRDEVVIADFNLGRMHGANVKWPVAAPGGRGGFGGGGGGGFGGRGGSADGRLGQNYLRIYDVDIDFGSDKLRFFAQDHCPGGVLYWKAPGPVGVVPITIEGGHIVVPITVDGKPIKAWIDTTSPASWTYATVADRVLGITLGGDKAPADKPSRGFGGGATYTMTGATIGFNQMTLPGVALQINADANGQGGDPGKDAINRKLAIESELASAHVLLGMDVMRKLHMFFSFAENKLYVSGTTDTRTAAATPADAPAAAKAP